LLEQGKLLATTGDGAGAAAAFAELAQFDERHHLGAGASLGARYAASSACLELGDLEKGDAMLRELIAAAPAKDSLDAEGPSIVAQARVARALVPLAKGELDDAAKQLQTLEQEHDLPPAARALCLTGLGELCAKRGEWAAAELWFTRVRVL